MLRTTTSRLRVTFHSCPLVESFWGLLHLPKGTEGGVSSTDDESGNPPDEEATRMSEEGN